MSNATSFTRLFNERVSADLLHELNKGRSKEYSAAARPSTGLSAIVEGAFRAAEQRAYLANSFDLILAILRDEKNHSALSECGLNIDAAIGDLQSALNAWTFRRVVATVRNKVWLLGGGDPWTTCLGRTIIMAAYFATLAGHKEYGGLHAVAAVWYADSKVPRYLQYRGMRLQWIRSLLSYGFPVPTTQTLVGDTSTDGPVLVRIHKDDFTQCDDLASLIRKSFDLTNAEEIAKKIHEARSVSIGPFERSMALSLVAYARQQAADIQSPVLFTLEPAKS